MCGYLDGTRHQALIGQLNMSEDTSRPVQSANRIFRRDNRWSHARPLYCEILRKNKDRAKEKLSCKYSGAETSKARILQCATGLGTFCLSQWQVVGNAQPTRGEGSCISGDAPSRPGLFNSPDFHRRNSNLDLNPAKNFVSYENLHFLTSCTLCARGSETEN